MPVPGGDAIAAAQNLIALTAPSGRFAAVTKSDTVDLPIYSRGLYIGGAGDVVVVGVDDVTNDGTLFKAVPAGTTLPVMARRVKATNSTATDIVAYI